MSIPQLSVLVPTRPEDIEFLREDWNRLADRLRGPTHRIEWAQTCLDTLWHPESGPVRLHLVRRDGRLTALAIMRMRREWGSIYFEDLGTREMGEPTDLLYESREDLAFLLDGMLGEGWPLVLCRLPGDSLVPEVLAERLKGRGKMRMIRGRNYPYVPLEQFPEGQLNSGRKSDLRRMRRRAEQRGMVRVDLGCPPVHEVQRLLDLAVEIEAASWKLGTPHALKLDKKTLGFLRNHLPRAAEAGTLRLAFMHIDEQPVAMQIAIQCGGGYWLLKIGYDAALGSMAPGQLLMQDTLKASVEAGLKSYELWGHAAEWTRMWTTHEMESHCVEAFPLGLRSARRIAAMAVRKMTVLAKAAISGKKPAEVAATAG